MLRSPDRAIFGRPGKPFGCCFGRFPRGPTWKPFGGGAKTGDRGNLFEMLCRATGVLRMLRVVSVSCITPTKIHRQPWRLGGRGAYTQGAPPQPNNNSREERQSDGRRGAPQWWTEVLHFHHNRSGEERRRREEGPRRRARRTVEGSRRGAQGGNGGHAGESVQPT